MLNYIVFSIILNCCHNEQYEKALPLLNIYTKPSNEILYWKAVCLHRTMQYEECITQINLIDFDDLDRRKQIVLDLMVYDIKEWKPGLEDIYRRMNRVSRRLAKEFNAKDETLRQQKEIVSELDKLIKEKEDALNNKDNKQENNGQNSEKSNTPMQPAQESELGGTSGLGEIEKKELRNYAENWGKLTDKERARALNTMIRDFPPEYKRVIEDYYKALSKN